MKKTIFCGLILLLACGKQTKEISDAQITIDVKSALGNQLSDYNLFVDSSWYVVLDTPKDKTQGLITKAVFHQDKIYTLDELQSKSLNVYDKSGHFLYDLSPSGKGPKESINKKDFSIYQNEVFVNDILGKRVQIFSTDSGAYIGAINFPFAVQEFHKIDSNKFMVVLGSYNQDYGEQYQNNTLLITDSLMENKQFFIPRPTSDMGNWGRSLWNECDGKNIFSLFDEALYKYNAETDLMEKTVFFDYGSDNIDPEKRKDFRAYMDFFADEDPMHITTESPLVVGDYVFALVNDGNSKYFMVNNGSQTYSRELTPNSYKPSDPSFFVGKSTDDKILISCVDPTIGIPQLQKENITIDGKQVGEVDAFNILVLSRLK